jgi:hypothetical protein
LSQISPVVKPVGYAAYQRRVAREERKQTRDAKVAIDSALAQSQASAGDGSAPPQRSEEARNDASAQRLGNNTKSRPPKDVPEDENPEVIQRFRYDHERDEYVADKTPEFAASVARGARFSAQNSATKLLFNKRTPRVQSAADEDEPVDETRKGQWRVTGCSRRKIGEYVGVLYAPSIKKAHFGGLMVCGSVWTCPPCAAKISERRKNEIQSATDEFKAAGGHLYMITLTFSHAREDDIASLMVRLADARQRLRRGKAYERLKSQIGQIGDIRTLEVTFGDKNGFHPHEHSLWLTASSFTARQLQSFKARLFVLWERACLKAGLALPNRKRGVDVRYAMSAAEYLAKFGRESTWGVASELSKQHVKSGRAESMSPFDLLRSYQAGNLEHGNRFIDYANAFFGKRQIIWSRGLKSLFGVQELTDQEVAEQEENDASLLAKIESWEWRVILRQPWDVRSTLLDLAEGAVEYGGGFDAVRRFVDHLTRDSAPF